jgi:hypothetical protein
VARSAREDATSVETAPLTWSRFHRIAPRVLVVDLALWVIGTAFVLTWWQRPVSGPSDAVAHVVLFGTLTLTALAVTTSHQSLGSAVRLVGVGVIGLSVASEGIQWAFVSGRSGSLEDVGFDLVGITLGALVFFAVRFFAREQANVTLALISTAALLVSAAVGVTSSIRDSDWWRCRGSSLTAMESDRVDASPGPVVTYDGATGTWQSSEGTESGPLLSDATSKAALCSAVRAQEFTVVAMFTVPEPPEAPIVVFGSLQLDPGVRSNFEIAVEGDSLIAQFRSGRIPRAAPRLTLPTEVFPGQEVSVVMRYGSEVLTVIVNGELTDSATVDAQISAWDLAEVLHVAARPTSPLGPDVRFAAFFDRAVTNTEVLGMFTNN